jgi:hypothetical protein
VPEGPVLQQGGEKGSGVAVITDEFMREMRAKARLYALILGYVVHAVRGSSGDSFPPGQGSGR